ncbi:MAG: nitroreductase [Bacilli bacterium]|nr:nitroreductase [Bacilli bacterium]
MNKDLYEMIFKRKSFHLFRNIGEDHLTAEELKDIEKEFSKLKPLVDDIKVKIKIVKDSTTCKRGQEYCILFYSEKKDNYLQNIGYLGEQLDLYLVSKNIGTLWFGIGKPDEKQLDGLDFVIMIAIAKVDKEEKFRKDMYKSKRKEISEIWSGNSYLDITNIVRFSPSACNTQPWRVESFDDELKVYRYRKEGKRGIMPKDMVLYYNQIDIGIFLCFLELCLDKNNISYNRELYIEENHESENNLVAYYKIKTS